MKKLLFLVAFAGSVTVGAACTSELTEACEDFVDVRDACELQNGDPPPTYSYDLCDNIDPERKEFYLCAVAQTCEEVNDKFRLQYKDNCEQPENKECTDADLRM